MTRRLLLLAVSTVAAVTTGCQCGNWFSSPCPSSVTPAVTYSNPAIPAAMPAALAAPALPPPAGASAPCGPGCTSCGNTLPILSGAQGYAPVPGN